jgi:hypothetical protein
VPIISAPLGALTPTYSTPLEPTRSQTTDSERKRRREFVSFWLSYKTAANILAGKQKSVTL